MLPILKPLEDKGGALFVILTVIILSIGGLYRLLSDDFDRLEHRVSDNEKTLLERADKLHLMDKRILILEIEHDREK